MNQPAERFEEDAEEVFGRAVRIAEAQLFASVAPVSAEVLGRSLPAGVSVEAVLERLGAIYAERGVNLRKVAGGYAFRTAPDLAYLDRKSVV